MWDLGNMKKVVVRDFKGKTYIDIREYYVDKNTMDTRQAEKMETYLNNCLLFQAGEEGDLLELLAVPETQVHHRRHRPRSPVMRARGQHLVAKLSSLSFRTQKAVKLKFVIWPKKLL